MLKVLPLDRVRLDWSSRAFLRRIFSRLCTDVVAEVRAMDLIAASVDSPLVRYLALLFERSGEN